MISLLRSLRQWIFFALWLAALMLSTDSVAYSKTGSNYKSAVLKLIYTIDPNQPESSFLDAILIPSMGEPEAQRVPVDPKQFTRLLSQFYSQVASLRAIKTSDSSSPARRLYDILIGPLEEDIQARNITTLLISANPGLQAVPFAALHDGKDWFGTRYSFSLTPSLSLMKQGNPLSKPSNQALLAGASTFVEMAPLPMVPKEIDQISKVNNANIYLDKEFTREVLDSISKRPDVQLVHLASHAEFLPGGPDQSKIYLGDGALSLKQFAELRIARDDNPLELFTLSACRTALGDRDSELGLAGLALQAGSKSAIGSLWYVDDLATTIYFIRFYRLLNQGIPKGEAMRQVRAELSTNQLILNEQSLYDSDGELLLDGLTTRQIRQLRRTLNHPFFWAAPILLGYPW